MNILVFSYMEMNNNYPRPRCALEVAWNTTSDRLQRPVTAVDIPDRFPYTSAP
jgi:hypothetical protein